MIDPEFLVVLGEPFVDLTLLAGDNFDEETIRIYQPSLGHVVALMQLGSPFIPDSHDGGNAWELARTISGLAILMSKPGTPQNILDEADEHFGRVDNFLHKGFGSWEETEESWGNPVIDEFLQQIVWHCSNACKPPEMEQHKGSKPSKNPWPLLLKNGCIPAGYTNKQAWKLTPAYAFWEAESARECAGRGSSIIGMQTKTAIATARDAANKILEATL